MTNEQVNRTIKTFLKSQHYTNITILEDDNVCAIMASLFTWDVCYGVDYEGCKGRFCFNNLVDARKFLKEWDGVTHPVVGENGCTAIK